MAATLLLLSACAPHAAKRVPTPPLVMHCDARCTAAADEPWPSWQGDPDDPKTWDALGYVIAALRERAEQGELARLACLQCLTRLERAGVICGLSGPCNEDDP